MVTREWTENQGFQSISVKKMQLSKMLIKQKYNIMQNGLAISILETQKVTG